MNIEEQLETLARQRCPREVDVVDAVMEQVRCRPYLRPVHRRVAWRRVALTVTATAAAAALVLVNVATPRSYDEEQIGSMMAYVSDYGYYMSVESPAAEPLGYLYDDYSNE